ncbi:adenosine deaminase [Nitriliruptoraceae bacterium ZYF776]|nr:adenosine deaminase [Profundirhabdus halotolerans]
MPAPDRDLTALPKVELHVHLEGSIEASTARELADRHDVALDVDDGGYPARYRDFAHFVATFVATSGVVRTPDDLAAVAAAFARDRARQRIHWTEATFTALTLVRGGMEPAAMWEALRDGFAEVPDVGIGLIVDTIRDLGPDAAHETIRLVDGADAPIVGLGLTGTEGTVPEEAFAHLRLAADQLGLGLAVHAGETGGPERVRAALDVLGADRVGHGIATLEDAELLARVVREATPLEVCPSSNVALGLVADLDHHPLPRLWAAGANVTVNSDDPAFFGTDLTHELAHAVRLCGLTRRDLAELQRRAVRASFAPADVRASIMTAIDGWAAAPVV